MCKTMSQFMSITEMVTLHNTYMYNVCGDNLQSGIVRLDQ